MTENGSGGLSPEVVERMRIAPTLATCERVIERALFAYAEAGAALRTIRSKRLYKQEGFSSFDDYCRKRWNWSRQHADQLVAAAEVHDVLYEVSKTDNHGCQFEAPRSERAARELAPLRKSPELLVQAWAETVERHGPEAEAKHVRQVVRRLSPPKKQHIVLDPERELADAVTAIRRLLDHGYTPRLLRDAIHAIDPEGK